MRSMSHTTRHGGRYYSTFDPSTGALCRLVDLGRSYDAVRSPSPETVDIAITSRCGFGCDFCYQDSTPRGEHGAKDLVEKTLQGFDVVPYQIAIGGGEPTIHPDFPEILHRAKELGTVPNYTTAGHNLTPAIIEATNEVCGGVAMTFHSWKGVDWFVRHYKRLRQSLTCQVNVHLIADLKVVQNLRILTDLQKTLGKMNVVLLAYYPNIGRATEDYLMGIEVYNKDFPEAIREASSQGMKLAFSEGLLPFFLSRPDLPVNTDFAMTAEGRFSCYISHEGQMSNSSFNHRWCRINRAPQGEWDYYTPTVFDTKAQDMWDNLSVWSHFDPSGEACSSCPAKKRCNVPDPNHLFICARQPSNRSWLRRHHLPVI